MTERQKIIVVDDSRAARMAVASALVADGFDVVEAVDGRDGVVKVIAHPDAVAVLCDMNMPIASGLDFLTALQTLNRPRPPVVMLTTESQPEAAAQARRLGARGWMVKPWQREHLLASVRALAAESRSQR